MSNDRWGHGEWEGEWYLGRDFLRISPLDRAGRRAVWLRAPPLHGDMPDLLLNPSGELLEVRAGREGDDYGVILKEGQVLDRETVIKLFEALAFMVHNDPEFR